MHRHGSGTYRGVYEATYTDNLNCRSLDVVYPISYLVIKENYSNLRVMQKFFDFTSA